MAGPGTYTCKCDIGFLGEMCEINCSSRKDVSFVLDASNSVGHQNFQLQLDFIASIVKEMSSTSNDHRFSLIVYATGVSTIFSFNRYSQMDDILTAIKSTKYIMGSTNTAGGLRQAWQMFQPGFGSRRDATDIVLLLTDGESNINFQDTIPAAEDLKKDGVRVIGIGIGLKKFDELNAIASSTSDVYKVQSSAELMEIQHSLKQATCSMGG